MNAIKIARNCRFPAGDGTYRLTLDSRDWGLSEWRSEAAECRPVDMVEGAGVGCFPDLYAALAGDPPDQVISL